MPGVSAALALPEAADTVLNADQPLHTLLFVLVAYCSS